MWARRLSLGAAIAALFLLFLLAARVGLGRLVGDGGDGAIASRVVDNLAALPADAGSGVAVRVEDGIVYLSGAVPSPDDMLDVERVVRHTGGVRGVVNGLSITDQGARPPGSSP